MNKNSILNTIKFDSFYMRPTKDKTIQPLLDGEFREEIIFETKTVTYAEGLSYQYASMSALLSLL